MAEEYRGWLYVPPEDGVIGKRRIRRQDGYAKTSGKGVYTRDVQRPGMLYAKFLTSPHAHAEIKSMDTSAAEAYPGVRAVLRYDDPEIDWQNHTEQRSGTYQVPILKGTTHWFAEPIGAVVVADSEQIVDEALKLIEIDWEVLPFILDWEEAMEPGAPLARPDVNPDNNLEKELTTEYGDVEAGFEEAHNVIEFKMSKTHEDVWAGVEAYCSVVEWVGENLEVWYHGQKPLSMQNSLNKYTSMDKVHVHAPYNGAQFGGLNWTSYTEAFPHFAVLAAAKTKRPVKFLHDTSHFHGAGEEVGSYYFKVGFEDNGEVTAVALTSYYNTRITYDQIHKLHNMTKVHNLSLLDIKPFLNRGPLCCYKHGASSCAAVTMVFDHVAAELGMDPTEVALINDGCEGIAMADMAAVKAEDGFDPTRDSLKECLEVGKAAIDWDNKWHAPGTKILPNGNYHGMGFAWEQVWCHENTGTSVGYGGVNCSPIGMKLTANGKLNILARHADIGQCGATAYSQAVADEVGLTYEDVTHRHFDDVGWDCTPGGGSFGLSRTLPGMVRAARKMKQTILGYADEPRSYGRPAFFPDMTPEDLDIKDSFVFEKANPENRVPVSSFVSDHSPAYASYQGNPFYAWDQPGKDTLEHPVMGRQCFFMEVEVDPDTGQVEVKKLVVVNDAGKVINPEACNGQQYGGSYMGVGRSNIEAVYYDPVYGVKMNDNLIGYPIPLMKDCGPIDCHLIETGLGYTCYGMFGIGENAGASVSTLTGPAIYNAIGTRVDDYPTTPDKVLKALGKV